MSRLVVVSNRVPSLADGHCRGGLAVALKAALEEDGGVWLGWSGRLVDNPATEPERLPLNGFGLATIDLSEAEFRGYYEQCANRCLWPLFHGRTDLAGHDRQGYGLYRKVNRRFAQALRSVLGDDDIVWVHDYHLIPLGTELRRLGVTAPLGFFLHTPFPSPDTLASLPWHRDMVEQLCAYDVVGLQTSESRENFQAAVERQSAAKGDSGRASYGRSMTAGHYPISIDTGHFAALAAAPETQRWCRRFKARMRHQSWAVGVERLDYTKGLAERFLAFEALLEQSPGLRGQLSLVQVAAPSRETVAEYQAMQHQLATLSGRINARLGSFDWTPIRYLNRSFDHTELAALYRVARMGVVTPLRDGMNLVAKEYVAAQDPDDPGVLVLSRFAGAAEELTDAVLVDPRDIMGMARALREALAMPLDERKARWGTLMRHLQRYDVHRWRRRFLDDLVSRRVRPVRPDASLTAA